MTGAEMERAIGFLLESHASLTAKVEQLVESHTRVDTSIERMEASIGRMIQEAAADRAEVRSAVNTMLSFAESMADNVKLLTEAQFANNRRVQQVEERLDSIENS